MRIYRLTIEKGLRPSPDNFTVPGRAGLAGVSLCRAFVYTLEISTPWVFGDNFDLLEGTPNGFAIVVKWAHMCSFPSWSFGFLSNLAALPTAGSIIQQANNELALQLWSKAFPMSLPSFDSYVHGLDFVSVCDCFIPFDCRCLLAVFGFCNTKLLVDHSLSLINCN